MRSHRPGPRGPARRPTFGSAWSAPAPVLGGRSTEEARESPGPHRGDVTSRHHLTAIAAVAALVVASTPPARELYTPTRKASAAPIWSVPVTRHAAAGRLFAERARARHRASRPVMRRHAPAQRPRATRPTAITTWALSRVGDRYRWGGFGPSAWDCSGFVAAAYARIGATLPRQTGAMLRSVRLQRVRRDQMRPGDIVWPERGHVALYLGDGRVVHAANPRQGVRVDRLWSFYAAARITRTSDNRGGGVAPMP